MIAGIVAYHNALSGPFVLDDIFAIPNNASIRTLWPPVAVFSPPPHSPVADRPLVNLSLAVNYAMSGLHVTSYHLLNLFVHVLSALLLFAVVLRTLRSPDLGFVYREAAPGIATASALLWVVHPLATESVDYTIQRTELLMAFFFLLTLHFAALGFESPGRSRTAGALAAFALGLASKEVIVVAPFVVLAYDWLFWSPSWKEALRRHRQLYVGFAGVLLFFVAVLGTRLRRAFTGINIHLSPWDYALTQSGVIVHYLRLAFWPYPLTADYEDWPIARSLADVLPSVVVVLTLLGMTAWGLVRRRKVAFLGVWFFCILAPTSSFRPLAAEVAAERRMYLPLASLVVAAVLAGDVLFRRIGTPKSVRVATVAVLGAILTLVTVNRNESYATTLSFWTDIVAKRPGNARARIWLGKHLQEEGKTAEAVRHLSEAVRLRPGNAEAQYGLGVVLASEGRSAEAIEHYREALRLDPKSASAHNNLAVELDHRGEIVEALAHYREALRLNPLHVGARYNLALALARQGARAEAIGELETAVRLKPDFQQGRRLLEELRREPSR